MTDVVAAQEKNMRVTRVVIVLLVIEAIEAFEVDDETDEDFAGTPRFGNIPKVTMRFQALMIFLWP